MIDIPTKIQLAEVLGNGKVLLMLCDTVYGLLGRAPETYKVLEQIKGRPEDKAFLQLFADLKQLEQSPWQLPSQDLQCYWPGPLTCVLAAKSEARQYLQKTKPYCWQESQAVRIPDHELLQDLCRQHGPLYSTSANRSGEAISQEPQELLHIFAAEIASGQILPYLPELYSHSAETGAQRILVTAKASTIVDGRTEPPRILRQGDFKIRI